MNLTEQLADDLYRLSKADFSNAVVHQAKRCLLDYLGCTIAGAEMLKEKANKLLRCIQDAQGDATLIGFNRKTSVLNAALLNGLSAHVAEMDDGVNSGIVHPGAPVFSALLPLAEKEKVGGMNLLTGVITGYEAAIRISRAIQPSHKQRGYHASGTCGTIGAAAGVAAMLGFSKSQIKDALSSAAISASGTLKVLEDTSQLKPFNVGRAALVGLLAASVANAGFEGPEDALSGSTGFLSLMADQCDLSGLQRRDAESLGLEKVYVKPFAACRYCHPAIEAALRIRSSHKTRPEDIEAVTVATYHWAVAGHDHTDIKGVSSARMSIPYGVAVAIVSGKADIEEFTPERISNPDVVALTKKVVIRSDERLTALFPAQCAAIVEVRTHEGDCYRERVDCPKGEPENPLSDYELQEKFEALAAYGNKTGVDTDEIAGIVWNVETDLHRLYRLL